MALSATPGNDLIKIQKVIKNLSISDIEIREEDD
jgi:ERCC4-related helicase